MLYIAKHKANNNIGQVNKYAMNLLLCAKRYILIDEDFSLFSVRYYTNYSRHEDVFWQINEAVSKGIVILEYCS